MGKAKNCIRRTELTHQELLNYYTEYSGCDCVSPHLIASDTTRWFRVARPSSFIVLEPVFCQFSAEDLLPALWNFQSQQGYLELFPHEVDSC